MEKDEKCARFDSIHIYFYSSFHNTHLFKAALQKMHESIKQCTVICYQRRLSYVFQKYT